MILQKQIQTSKAIILIIDGLPENAQIRVYNYNELVAHPIGNIYAIKTIKLTDGAWQPLGFLKDIQEDVAKDIVSIYDYNMQYTNYNDGLPFSFEKATQSLHSLIEANCKLKNKYGSKPATMSNYLGDPLFTKRIMEGFNKKWQEEQSQVFTNPFLLKKI